jgi:hypothetical protein
MKTIVLNNKVSRLTLNHEFEDSMWNVWLEKLEQGKWQMVGHAMVKASSRYDAALSGLEVLGVGSPHRLLSGLL